MNEAMGIYDRLKVENMTSIAYSYLRSQYLLAPLYINCGPHIYCIFLVIYIKSLRSHTRPDRGKPALLLMPIDPSPTNYGASVYSETIYMLIRNNIYG
jgi:hypothetical protein